LAVCIIVSMMHDHTNNKSTYNTSKPALTPQISALLTQHM